MIKPKWFIEPQKQIKEQLDSYIHHGLVEQIVTKDNVFEKYIVQNDEELSVILFQMKRVDYGKGYKIFEFKSK